MYASLSSQMTTDVSFSPIACRSTRLSCVVLSCGTLAAVAPFGCLSYFPSGLAARAVFPLVRVVYTGGRLLFEPQFSELDGGCRQHISYAQSASAREEVAASDTSPAEIPSEVEEGITALAVAPACGFACIYGWLFAYFVWTSCRFRKRRGLVILGGREIFSLCRLTAT